MLGGMTRYRYRRGVPTHGSSCKQSSLPALQKRPQRCLVEHRYESHEQRSPSAICSHALPDRDSGPILAPGDPVNSTTRSLVRMPNPPVCSSGPDSSCEGAGNKSDCEGTPSHGMRLKAVGSSRPAGWEGEFSFRTAVRSGHLAHRRANQIDSTGHSAGLQEKG